MRSLPIGLESRSRISRGCVAPRGASIICFGRSVRGYKNDKDVERAYRDPGVTIILLGFFDLTVSVVSAVKSVRDFAIDVDSRVPSIKDNWERYLFSKGRAQRTQRRYAVFWSSRSLCVGVPGRAGLWGDLGFPGPGPYARPWIHESPTSGPW